MPHMNLTTRYEDLSTERGVQFRFRCDACGRGYETQLQTFTTRHVPDLLHGAAGLFGAIWDAGDSTRHIHHHGGHVHDEALAMALAEARANFQHCTGCGRWVCSRLCWDLAAGLCKECARP